MKKENANPEKGKLLMRTYLTSLLCLVLCVTMLLGTTYAWFTSEVTTAGNEIYVGTLKVDMTDAKGNSLQGKSALFGNVDGKAFRWEPGATQVETVKIVNKGDLSFAYGVYLSTIGNVNDIERTNLAKIGKHIEVYTLKGESYTTTKFDKTEWELQGTLDDLVRVGTKLAGGTFDATATVKAEKQEKPDEVASITLALHMKEETSDPQIMGMSVTTVGLKLIATQINKEADAFGTDYDSNLSRADLWDGTADADGLAANTKADAKTVDIYTAEQFAAFAEAVNAGNTYEGYTVRLQSSLNLANKTWMPIGLDADTASKVFMGTFDGQNYTVYNLKVSLEPAYQSAGLFGATQGTLKNFTVNGANIQNTVVSSNGQSSNGTAVIAGSTAYGATVTNVHVTDATVSGNRYVGGIVGYMRGTVEFCSVTKTTLTATPNVYKTEPAVTYDNGDKVGGIVGYVNSGESNAVVNCEVTDSTVSAFRDVGGIVGMGAQLKVFTSNHAEKVTVTYVAAPGTMEDGSTSKNANALVGRDYTPDDTNTFKDVTLPN